MDKEARETIIADLNKMLQETTGMIENLIALQVKSEMGLGDLRPAIDAMGAFQREVMGYLHKNGARPSWQHK